MPRGVRAVHEFQREAQMAAHEPLIGYVPVSAWLPTLCMCERKRVVALQRDVRECVPYSCGDPRCVGIPSPVILGTRADTAMLMEPGMDVLPGGHDIGPRYDRTIDGMIAEQGDVLGRKVPRPSRARMHVVTAASVQRVREEQDLTDRIGRGTVGARREDVAQLWRENLPVVTIAARLGINVNTAYADIRLLKAKGRLP